MSDIAIRAENLSKKYHIGGQRNNRNIREAIRDAFKSPLHRARGLLRGQAAGAGELGETIWALRDISIEVNEGEALGIIGRNASGKSTLLKILSRITEPTEGFAEVRGRIGSLLEVGTGFHPELTGRENIFLNGAILGMKKAEIRQKFDEIVEFSEVEKFIDTPVKHYSSGMYLRLAFAVAAHLEPRILVVDEVLSVGDQAFQKKCMNRMQEIGKQGRTILFVSHHLAAVEGLCQRGIVLQEGKLAFCGSAKQAVDYYLRSFTRESEASSSHIFDLSNAIGRPKGCRPLLRRLEFYTDEGKPLNGGLKMGSSLKAYIYFQLEEPASSFDVCLGFDNLLGQRIFTAHSIFQPDRPKEARVGEQIFVCEIPSLTLVPGKYTVLVTLTIPRGVEVDRVQNTVNLVITESDYYGTGHQPWAGAFVLKHHWYLK